MAGEDLAQLRYLQELYGERYELISQEIRRRIDYIQELNNVSTTLNSMDEIAGKPIFDPIGGEFYISGSASKDQKCLVGVGAGYMLEKNTDEAKEFAAKLIKKGEVLSCHKYTNINLKVQ